MTEAIYPTILHQDPRYFRRGVGAGWWRFGYACGQIFWTHQIIAQSAYRLTRKTLGKDLLLWLLFASVAITTVWTGSEIVWLFVLCGVISVVVAAAPAFLSKPAVPSIAGGFGWLLTGIQNATLTWRPMARLRITPDYRQENQVNGFVPFFPLFGNMSYHQLWAGAKVDYALAKGLDVEVRYRRSDITRSNAFLWPQIYSFDNTDLLTVVPSSSSNLAGLTLRYHASELWSARAGYEWIGTHSPGYSIVPGSNNRVFGDLTLTPRPWLIFTNNTSAILQNAFPVIQRRNRFYDETATTTLVPVPNWNLQLGYSYQQNNLATYMAFQNDAAAGYVVDEPFVPYRQLSQTYWFQSASRIKNRFGLNLGLTHNSAHSGLRPNVNPNDYALLGNAALAQQSAFDPVLFQQALQALTYGSALTQMNVPQLIAQGKIYSRIACGMIQ